MLRSIWSHEIQAVYLISCESISTSP